MLLGEIVGKTSTKEFLFRAYSDNIKRLDFVAVKNQNDAWVLCQIDNIEYHPDGRIIAKTNVLGYRENGILMSLKMPLKPDSLVYSADEDLIKDVLSMDEEGAYIGVLEANENVGVKLNIESLISKHMAVLATTGSGKSYAVGVIVEELLEKNIPVVILDPHGEHNSFRYPNDNERELALMPKFGIKPKSYDVVEYSPDPRVNPNALPLRFEDKNLDSYDLLQMFATKPSSAQISVLYGAIKDLKGLNKDYTLDDIINMVANSESTAKWNVISMLEYIKDMGIFSKKYTPISKLLKNGRATTINMRGVAPEIQSLVAYKVVEELFEKRKMNRIPPFFLIVEEAHNFIPEKEVTKSSKILRTVASEGRKFGMGLCVITQRPARIDKNVLSQCNTQLILKITNPNDLKAISYAEGMTQGIENEIKNLNPGRGIIVGKEIPLFVKIRVRRSKHGGETVSISAPQQEYGFKVIKPFSQQISVPKQSKVVLYPCWNIEINGKNYLLDAVKGRQIYVGPEGSKEMEFTPNFVSYPVNVSYEVVDIDAEVLKEEIYAEKVKNALRAMNINKIDNIEKVYYPYFLGSDFMMDAVTGKVMKMSK